MTPEQQVLHFLKTALPEMIAQQIVSVQPMSDDAAKAVKDLIDISAVNNFPSNSGAAGNHHAACSKITGQMTDTQKLEIIDKIMRQETYDDTYPYSDVSIKLLRKIQVAIGDPNFGGAFYVG